MTKLMKKTGGFSAAALTDAFQRLNDEGKDDPLLNPVRRLATDVFRALESGETSIEAIADVVADMNDAAFEDRSRGFRQRRSRGASVHSILQEAAEQGFDAFRRMVERPQAGVVFTAHPTFSLGETRRNLMARFPQDGDPAALDAWRREAAGLRDAPAENITLRYEHGQARKAVVNAQTAFKALNRDIIAFAAAHFPNEWRALNPQPISIATWVGYDLDGRTDIHWGETIRIRLEEKAAQLRRYAGALSGIVAVAPDDELARLCDRLEEAAGFTERQTAAFGGDLDDPDTVVAAANLLTAPHAARLTSLKDAIDVLTAAVERIADRDAQIDLMTLRAEMQACGLGVARIHLRVNAAQVRSALRADLGLDPDGGFMGRSALDIAAAKATDPEARAVSFGSVFLEKMTARRQFMLCAQILKHIDADTPIRFLIAECEAPATVMGAVYLARLYGVEKKLDISPLFETPEALGSGGRFLQRLLKEREYREYILGRRRMAIQLGFSDSGRFMGQCAAALAIERLQVLFGRALDEAKLSNVEALIFNTHGESMGRGAHPVSFRERLHHIATPWVRSRFAKDGIPLKTECSFQGGEGYLHFQTPAFAQDTLNAVWADAVAPTPADENDRYYTDLNFSWDLYRGLKAWQEDLFEREDYRRILSSFPQNFLFKTGSRQTRRQKRGGGLDLSGLRAIPHNAILQQLGAPTNVSGGIGVAAGREAERLVEHIGASQRMRELIAYAHYARSLTDVSILRAYAALYEPAYWTGLALDAGASAQAEAYEAVQEALGRGDVAIALDQLGNYLSRDLRRFDAICSAYSADSVKPRAPGADRLRILHALRQALTARAVSLAARAPAFSRRHDVDHGDLVRMAVDLQFGEAVAVLKDIFPRQSDAGAAFSGLEEKVDDEGLKGGAYPDIHANIIEPLEAIARLLPRVSEAVAHHYGAFG